MTHIECEYFRRFFMVGNQAIKKYIQSQGSNPIYTSTSRSCIAFNINLSDAGERVEHGMSITRRSILLSSFGYVHYIWQSHY